MRSPQSICMTCEFRQRGTITEPLRGPCMCMKSLKDLSGHQAAGSCPMGYFDEDSAPLVQLRPRRALTIAERGPLLWKELHTRAFNAVELSGEAGWLEAFEKRIPCGECKRHWREVLAEYPPDFRDAGSYFRWSWIAHNIVSRKIGKAQISLAQAFEKQEAKP